MRRFALWLLVLGLWPLAAAAVEIREWKVPWDNTRPRDPYLAPDGRVWLVGQVGNYLAVFDPKTEKFERFDLPAGTKPHTVVVDADGFPWISGNGNGTVLRFDAQAKQFKTYAVPDTPGLKKKDPHTFSFDGKGGIWFTLQQGNGIGRLDMASGEMRIAIVPTANALPYGIVSTADGRPWAVLLGTNKLATVDPQSFAVTEFEIPRAHARPRRIGLGSDGRIWYVDFTQGYLGVYDPKAKTFEEHKAPSASSGPYAMAVDSRDRVWFVETFPQPNLLQGFDPKAAQFLVATPIPSGGQVVRHMVYDPKTDSLWFGTDTNQLGRADLSGVDQAGPAAKNRIAGATPR